MILSKKLWIIGLSMFLIEPCIQSYDNDKHIKSAAGIMSVTPKQWAVGTVSLYALSSLYCLWVFHKASEKDVDFVEKTYPYAQDWYDDLAVKYPQAHLGEKQFLQGTFESDRYMRWDYFYNQIYCHKTVLQYLNVIYQKKEKNEALLPDELLFLAIQEFAILRQAGHIENNHVMTTRAYSIGILMGLEALKLWYKEYALNVSGLNTSYRQRRSSADWEQNITFTEWVVFFLLQAPLSKSQYFDSYNFACQHVDINVLQQMVLFYERYHRDKKDRTYLYLSGWKEQFYSNPEEYLLPEVRCAMIRKEIEHRMENRNEK